MDLAITNPINHPANHPRIRRTRQQEITSAVRRRHNHSKRLEQNKHLLATAISFAWLFKLHRGYRWFVAPPTTPLHLDYHAQHLHIFKRLRQNKAHLRHGPHLRMDPQTPKRIPTDRGDTHNTAAPRHKCSACLHLHTATNMKSPHHKDNVKMIIIFVWLSKRHSEYRWTVTASRPSKRSQHIQNNIATAITFACSRKNHSVY
jgi:hypothetical protein